MGEMLVQGAWGVQHTQAGRVGARSKVVKSSVLTWLTEPHYQNLAGEAE